LPINIGTANQNISLPSCPLVKSFIKPPVSENSAKGEDYNENSKVKTRLFAPTERSIIKSNILMGTGEDEKSKKIFVILA
jgi:hypothetical protein